MVFLCAAPAADHSARGVLLSKSCGASRGTRGAKIPALATITRPAAPRLIQVRWYTRHSRCQALSGFVDGPVYCPFCGTAILAVFFDRSMGETPVAHFKLSHYPAFASNGGPARVDI